MQSNFENIVQVIKENGVIVMPTDTVYGIVCSTNSPEAVEKMFSVKQRTGKLGTILFADKKQLLDFGFGEKLVDKAMEYWPGTVSVVLPVPQGKEYLAKEWNSLAVRIPEPKWLQDLLIQTGPLATTSANYPDQPTVTNIEEAKKLFGDKIDFYLDGGETKDNKPSRIIKINTDGSVEVLRD